MSRCLFISAYLPSDRVPAAGNRLSGFKLAEITGEYEVVDAVSFRNDLERLSNGQVPAHNNLSVTIFEISRLARIVAAVRYPWLPSGSAVRRLLARKHVAKLLRRNEYSAIFIDFTQAGAVIPSGVLPRASLRVHDSTRELYARKARERKLSSILYFFEYVRSCAHETVLYRRIGRIGALSLRDATEINRSARRNDCEVTPPVSYYVVQGRGPETISPDTILFWANFAREENRDAAQYMIHEIMPKILAARPKATLILAGANPPPELVRASAPGVTWTGYVEDPSTVFRRAAIGVVPMRQGAGVKIKTLEFLAAGIPTVATDIGAEGVPKHSLLQIQNDPAEFAYSCIRLLDSVAQSTKGEPDV